MMFRIVRETEAHMRAFPFQRRHTGATLSIAETVCESVAHAASDLNMRAIVVFTETGTTARLISKYRPPCPIYAFATEPHICCRMNLFWGVQPFPMDHHRDTVEMIRDAEGALRRHGLIADGDVIGITTGTRMQAGFTNVMLLRTVSPAAPVKPGAPRSRS
jgi:pyruvate kinase